MKSSLPAPSVDRRRYRLFGRGRIQDRRQIVVTVLWLAMAAVGYRAVCADLLQQWQMNPSYSHGWLVVPIAGWLLWGRRAHRPPLGRPWLPAFGLLLTAQLLLLAGEAFYLPGLQRWTLPVWVAGFIGVALGRALLRWSLPAVGFLCFMIPLPFQAEQICNQVLQNASAWISCLLLSMLGIFAVSDGHSLILETARIEITTACSGLRMATALAALSYVLAVVSRSGWPVRIAFLLLMVPTAVAANAVRICGFAWAVHHCDVSQISSWVHETGDWLMVPLAAGLLLTGACGGRRYRQNACALLQNFARGHAARAGGRMAFSVFSRSVVCLSPLPAAVLVLAAVQHYNAQQAAHRDSILQQAVAAESRGDWRAAVERYEYQLRFAPNEFASLAKRAIALERLAVTNEERIEALGRYAALLRESPYDPPLLRRHLELALSLGAARAALASARRLDAMGSTDRLLRQAIVESQLRFMPAHRGVPPVSGETLATLLSEDGGAPRCRDTLLVASADYLCRFPGLASAASRRTLEARLPAAVERLDSAADYLTRWQYARQFNVAWATDEDLRLALQRSIVGQSAHVFLAAAQQARRHADLDGALRLLELAQQGRQPDAVMLTELGDLYRQRLQPMLAVQAYWQAFQASHGGDPLLAFKLAETLHGLGKDEAAARLLKQVDARLSQRVPVTPALGRLRDDVLLLSARIAIGAGRYDDALAALDRVETSFSAGDDPVSAQRAHDSARRMRVRCLVSMERYSEAATLLERLVQTDAAPRDLLAAAARAWLAAGQPVRARSCYCRAANADENLSDAWLEYLGFLVAEDQATEAASEVAWRERRIGADAPVARLRIAQGWELVGRAELAESHYRAAAQQDLQHVAALAIHLARRGKIEEAVGLVADQPPAMSPAARAHTVAVAGLAARSLDPATEQTIDEVICAGLKEAGQDPQMLVAVANWYACRGRTEGARMLLDRAVAADPENLIAANNRAMLLAEDPQQCSQALAAIDSIIERAGPAGEFLDTRGWILLQMNRPHEAAEQFQQAIQGRLQSDPVPHFHLAAACLGIGDDHQARRQWDRAQQLQLDPTVLNHSERRALEALQRRLSPAQSEERG